MAIIVPSKNIYRVEHNTIIENQINKIELISTDVSTITTKNDLAHKETSEDFELSSEFTTLSDYVSKGFYNDGTGMGGGSVAYAKYDNLYMIDKTITIKRDLGNNKYLSKFTNFFESDDNANSKISYTIYGKIKKGTASSSGSESRWLVSVNINDFSDLIVSKGGINYSAPTSETEGIITLPKTIIANYEADDPSLTIQKELEFTELYEGYVLDESVTQYKLRFLIPVGVRTTTLSGYAEEDISDKIAPYFFEIEVNGEYQIYEPTRVDISFYGEVISLDLTEENIVVGDRNSKSIYSIDQNELLQKDNLYQDENATNKLANDTINQYESGKETLVLLCSISDYYDTDTDSIAISITDIEKPMLFSIGDVIEPYIINELGEEIPISENPDNTPKQFKIIGVKKIFDGACWQQLICQEFFK